MERRRDVVGRHLVHLQGLGVFVVAFRPEGPDIGFELAGLEVCTTALQLLARQFGEPAFDLIDPRRRSRRKVDMPVRPHVTSQAFTAAVLWAWRNCP